MNAARVIVTGAAGGIGRAIAFRYARASSRIALVDIDGPALHRACAELEAAHSAEVIALSGDLSEESFLQEVVRRTELQWGGIDVLVNNAAWRSLGSMRTINRADWQRAIDVCLTAPAFLAKHAAESMERCRTKGVIVNVSSMMSDRPAGNSPAYIAAKAGLEGLTRELAVTYGRSGIRVVCVRPGYIDAGLSHVNDTQASTDGLTEKLGGYLSEATPLGGPGRPEEVAEAVHWLSTPAASFITGTSLTIDGGLISNLNAYHLKALQFPDEYGHLEI